MSCATCGSGLRRGAKFCNRCGTPVTQAAATAGEARPTIPPSAPAALLTGDGALKPRAGNITTQLEHTAPPFAHGGLAANGSAAATVVASGAAVETVPLPPTPSGGPARVFAPEDQLPWPLVVGLILDGRYRVEAVAQTGDSQNTYAVTDLRGYERCWACGQVYGASAAGERFCRECGADMFARELIMLEHPLAPGEQPFGYTSSQVPDAEDPAEEVHRFVQSGRAFEVRPKVVRRSSFPQGVHLVAGAASDPGRTRAGEINEDSALVIVLDRVYESRTVPLGLFVVADGLGGHASGNRASKQAIQVMAHTILRQLAMPLLGSPSDPAVDESMLSDLLVEAVQETNLALCANNKESGLDAGSTIVAALVVGDTAYIANVGDSRAYVLDRSGLRRITSDHSLVQQLVAGGLIAPDDVYTHPQRNQIFRSLGDAPDLAVDVFVQQLAPSMRLLLCSDGLWEMVRDPRLEELLRTAADPQTTCDQLIEAANEGGGEDNITAVVIEAR